MKKYLKPLFLSMLLFSQIITCGMAGPIPNGDTQVTPIEDLRVGIGLQYRIMANGSNIPLSGVTTPAETESYNFFRQRMRINLDIKPSDNTGGFVQLEYRGGWGGSSPASSDPRGAGLSLNAFNRLEARGVRYGYIYYTPAADSYLAAGIIPVSDQLGDTLFSADWDFNAGGIVYKGRVDRLDYRLAWVRMVDGIASSDRDVVGKDSGLYVGDADFTLSHEARIGAHVYFLNAPEKLGTALGIGGKITQGWYAVSGALDIDSLELNGFICLNSGHYGTSDNTGTAVKLEAGIPMGEVKLDLMAIYTSGDREGKTAHRFRTVQGIFGTEGYWAYTHIFTPNGPSDVNDMGIGIDNGGKGITTAQARLTAPLSERLTGEFVLGWFTTTKENAAGDSTMGTEVSAMGTYALAKDLSLQLGAAYAFLGDFYKTGNDEPENLYEIFSRLQLQF
ncbi:MAG: hypothetical protein GXP53_10620 [Deltaproteobacteria bacterium]|nr:hypothetical protein [Deltaproteobacteria bacterium]